MEPQNTQQIKKPFPMFIIYFIIILLIAILIGSYVFIKNQSTPQLTVTPNTQISNDTPKDLPFLPPPTGASEAERIKYFEQRMRMAKASNTITLLKDCQADPAVTRVKKSTTFTVINKDSVIHTVHFSNGSTLELKKDESKPFAANTFDKPGMYAIRCDSAEGQIHGYLFIVE